MQLQALTFTYVVALLHTQKAQGESLPRSPAHTGVSTNTRAPMLQSRAKGPDLLLDFGATDGTLLELGRASEAEDMVPARDERAVDRLIQTHLWSKYQPPKLSADVSKHGQRGERENENLADAGERKPG